MTKARSEYDDRDHGDSFGDVTQLPTLVSDDIPTETPFGIKVPRFAPWRGRARRDGWTEHVQRLFVYALTAGATINAAAKLTGMTQQSYARLRRRAGAESFAAACDAALELGRDNVWQRMVMRTLEGAEWTRFRHGRPVGTLYSTDHRLLMAVLRHDEDRQPGLPDIHHALDRRRRLLDQWERRLAKREANLKSNICGH